MRTRSVFIFSLFALGMICVSNTRSAAQDATAPTPDAKAASDAVAKVFTLNPVAILPATHKPLPTTGSWSVLTLPPQNVLLSELF